MQKGTVEMGNTALYYYWGMNPAFTFGTSLPFGLNTRQHMSWMLFDGGVAMLNDLLKEHGCHGIATGSTGAQMGGWFRKEIKTVDDLKGLKFRFAGFAGRSLRNSAQCLSKLQAVISIPPWRRNNRRRRMGRPLRRRETRLRQGCKILLLSGLVEGTGPGHNVINTGKWNELPKHYQAALTAASHEQFAWVTGKYDAVNPGALKTAGRIRGATAAISAGGAGDLLQGRK